MPSDYRGDRKHRAVMEVTSACNRRMHSFANNGTDGCHPVGGLVMDKKGNMYGTTSQGGANVYGTVYKVTP